MSPAAQLSFRRLEVFCLVIEEGGVTRAAERLFVAQPAVSSQLRELERWLDAKLFVRKGGGLVLTEAGQRTYLWAKETLAHSVQVRRDVQELANGSGGSVVVASSMAVGTYLLPPIMAALRQQRPGADITVHVMPARQALDQIATGEADFAVLSWHAHDLPRGLAREELRDEPLVLCTAADHEMAGQSIPLAKLAELPMLAVPQHVPYQQSIDFQLRELGVVQHNIVLRLGHAEAGKRVVRDHGWFALFPRYCVEEDLAEGRLALVTISDASLHEQISLFHRHDRYLSPLQQSAIEAIRAQLATT